MTFVSCSIPEQFVNPLFEVFDGGDLVLSSYRDIEESLTRMRIFLPDAAQLDEARTALRKAMSIVGVSAALEVGELADENWKLAYRRHFKTERIGSRLLVVPVWEMENVQNPDGRQIITLDPGMAFGTGKHETTRACLEYIDELSNAATPQAFLDMGTGSGILSIAAAKLGYRPVEGFDVDQEAIDAANENAQANGVQIPFFKYGLGAKVRRTLPCADLVVANILGPLLIRFADEIVPTVRGKLIISGILTEIYDDVLAAYTTRGLRELSRKTIGEWTTGLLSRT